MQDENGKIRNEPVSHMSGNSRIFVARSTAQLTSLETLRLVFEPAALTSLCDALASAISQGLSLHSSGSAWTFLFFLLWSHLKRRGRAREQELQVG